MKIYKIIGIDPVHYEEIKYDTFINWVIKNAKTPAECQDCLSDEGFQNYFMKQLGSVEIQFVAHLQMFKKPLTGQDKLDLYFDYLKRFNVYFPKALKPKVSTVNNCYEYN